MLNTVLIAELQHLVNICDVHVKYFHKLDCLVCTVLYELNAVL